MGNMSPFPIEFQGHTYRTTEALFQSLRFNDLEIKALIREEKSPMGAKFVAKARVNKMSVEPLSQMDVENMGLCIKLKLKQHPDLVKKLTDTGDSLIVEDVTKRGKRGSNLFWGAMLVDGEWIGKNILGNIWMCEREIINKYLRKYLDERKGNNKHFKLHKQ